MGSSVRPEKAKVEITEQFAKAKRTLLWYSAAAIIVALSLESRGTLQPLLGIQIDKSVLAGMLFCACLYYGIQWAADLREQWKLLRSYKQSVESEQLRNLHDEMVEMAGRLNVPMSELQQQLDEVNDKARGFFVERIQRDIENALDGYVKGFTHHANELAELARPLNSLAYAANRTIGEESENLRASFEEQAIASAQDLASNFDKLQGISTGLAYKESALRNLFLSEGLAVAISTSFKEQAKPKLDQLERTLEVVSKEIQDIGAPLRKFSDFEKELSRYDTVRLVIMDGVVPAALVVVALLLNWRQLAPLLVEIYNVVLS